MITVLATTAFTRWPQFVGEVALLSVAAIAVGFALYKFLPPSVSPKVAGALVPFLVLGLMAYLGNVAAATALFVFIVLALAAIALGLT
jgi:hypothetical protein